MLKESRHRFAGWPGAFCLDCFADDQIEICIGEHDVLLKCVDGHFLCTEHEPSPKCKIHVNLPCSKNL